MTHASESQHWYTRRGEPAYSVKAKAGHDRPTHLGDARKLGLVPGVSSIIRCAAAPGLEKWKADQLMLSALTLPRRPHEPEKEWLSRVVQDSREQARKAAERGTSIHAAIQGHFEGEQVSGEYAPHIEGAKAALALWAGEAFDHECCCVEQSFAHALGFGGKADLLCTSPEFIADFKTKEFSPDDELKTWDEHAMQLAAYRHGLDFVKARGVIVYVSASYPGLATVIEIPEEELQKGWKMFYSLLHYWQAKNGYVSSFERMAA